LVREEHSYEPHSDFSNRWVYANCGSRTSRPARVPALGSRPAEPHALVWWPEKWQQRPGQRKWYRNLPFRQRRGGNLGMVQKRPFSGNTWALSAHPDRSRVGAGLRESLAAVLGLQFRENRVYPRSSSQ